MGIATYIGVADGVSLWPGTDAHHYRLDPPMVERDWRPDGSSDAVGEYADVLVWEQPGLGEHQAAKMVMIPATATGFPSGRTARPISELTQGPYRLTHEGLFYVNGYTIQG